MLCPICQKRKAKRFCPAKAESICSVCCGTEREVTIDCPPECPHLVASRQYDYERREVDWDKIPFADTKIPPSFVIAHQDLLLMLAYKVCLYARENPELVDEDVIAAVQSLAQTYRTRASGIIYEQTPNYRLQRELYDELKNAIADYQEEGGQRAGVIGVRNVATGVRDSEIRDTLIFLTQLGATRSNGRPKGRVCLDLLRTQFRPDAFVGSKSKIVLLS